jgi:hypothetical protein
MVHPVLGSIPDKRKVREVPSVDAFVMEMGKRVMVSLALVSRADVKNSLTEKCANG